MPSFFARNISRYFALSVMEKRERPSTQPAPDEVAEGVNAWNNNMRWLIPFVQASGYQIVIENPKSHEKIVIDKDTKEFPFLSSSWLRRYNEQELTTWIANEEKLEKARKIAEERGRAKYGNGYKATDKEIQDVLSNL